MDFPKKYFPKKSALKKISIFSQKAPNFLKTEIPEKSLYFRRGNFLIFQETKLSYISGDGTTSLYFRKRNISYFGKGKFRTLAYLELEAYSELWHIQNHGIFRTRDISRTLSNIYDGTFCKNSYLARLKKVLIFSGNGTFWV